MQPTKEDISLLLAAKCHLGSTNVSNRMKPYIFSRRPDGIFIIHIGKLWEKLILAARVLVTIENWEDIFVTSSSLHGRRPANKVAGYLGAMCNLSRFPPGQFTKSLVEPRLLLCMDPYDDAQAISEASKCNIPVIAFANSHSPLKHVDIGIPCNNLGARSIGVMCWLLTRAVLRLRGAVRYDESWPVIPDMFFYNQDHYVEVIEEQEDDYKSNKKSFDQQRGAAYGGGSCAGGYGSDWADDDGQQQGGFSMAGGEDDGVNWESDMPKATARASGAWDDEEGVGQENLTFSTSNWSAGGAHQAGTDNRNFSYTSNGSVMAQPPRYQQLEHVDWAEDVPTTAEEQSGHQQQIQPEEEGWDNSPDTGNRQWQGAGNTPL